MGMWLVTAAAVIGAPALKERKPTDDEITKTLVGTWAHDQSPGTTWTSTEEFAADGTWRATSRAADGTVKLSVFGVWHVRGGALRRVVETCDPPRFQKGFESTEELLLVAPQEFRRKPPRSDRPVRLSRVP